MRQQTTTTNKAPTAARRRAPAPPTRRPRAGQPEAAPLAPNDVVGALLVEHRYAARLLEVLEQQLDAMTHGQRFDREAMLSVMNYMTEYPDAYHHPREDAMFVRLAKRDPHLRKRIGEIERAHRTIGKAGKELRAAIERLQPERRGDAAKVASRIGDYVGALREHMAIEEREVFPQARRLLDEEDLTAVDRDFRRVTDPVFEASVRQAYAAYPAVVRMLVEQPTVGQVLDVLDAFHDSALTLAELLFGGAAARRS